MLPAQCFAHRRWVWLTGAIVKARNEGIPASIQCQWCIFLFHYEPGKLDLLVKAVVSIANHTLLCNNRPIVAAQVSV